MPACSICGEALDDFNASYNNPNICSLCAGEADADLNLESNEDQLI